MRNTGTIGGKLILASAMGLLLAGCWSSPSSPEDEPAAGADGVVKSDILLGKVGVLTKTATLGKASAITMRKVYFTLASSAGDTVQDSSTVSGSEQVVVNKVWTLKPLRTWTLSARSLDLKDSVIHLGTTAPFQVKPADTVSVNLSLASRFTMYEARFQALPDSISSSAAGTGKDKLNLNRLTLKVDGVTRADSAKAAYFVGGQAVTLFYDYITPGSHTVVLEATGKLNAFEGVLYRGTATFNVAAGADETRTVTLDWVGPSTGSGKLTVTLGRVGKVVVNGTLPGAVIQ